MVLDGCVRVFDGSAFPSSLMSLFGTLQTKATRREDVSPPALLTLSGIRLKEFFSLS
jgi:hypothetical protein